MRCQIWSLLLAATVLVFQLVPSIAAADTISIDFSGLNLKFVGGQIYDADHVAGGSGNVADATPLVSVSFTKNVDQFVESIDSDVFVDVLIAGVPNIPKNGSVLTTGTSFVELLTSTGPILKLPFDSLHVAYNDNAGWVTVAGIVSGPITQNLPGGLSLGAGDEVTVLLNGDGPWSTTFDGQGRLTGFESFGTGQVASAPIPEPSSLALLMGLAACSLAAMVWRRRKIASR